MGHFLVKKVCINPQRAGHTEFEILCGVLEGYKAWGLVPGMNLFSLEPITVVITEGELRGIKVTVHRLNERQEVFHGPAEKSKDPMGEKYVIEVGDWTYYLYI